MVLPFVLTKERTVEIMVKMSSSDPLNQVSVYINVFFFYNKRGRNHLGVIKLSA